MHQTLFQYRRSKIIQKHVSKHWSYKNHSYSQITILHTQTISIKINNRNPYMDSIGRSQHRLAEAH